MDLIIILQKNYKRFIKNYIKLLIKSEEKMDMMYEITINDITDTDVIKKTVVFNLFGIEYYIYAKSKDGIDLTIYTCATYPIKVHISEEEFNRFEDAIKINTGFFSKRTEKKK